MQFILPPTISTPKGHYSQGVVHNGVVYVAGQLPIKVNVFVSDITLWPAINAEYSRIMGSHKPARIVIPCNTLNYGCGVEIDCIAAINENEQ